MNVDWLPSELLWRGALAVIPVALLVAAIGRLFPCRPSTRHAMWLVVLALLVAVPLLPRDAIPQLPVGPPTVTVQTPLTELAHRRSAEAHAPTASAGPPAAAFESPEASEPAVTARSIPTEPSAACRPLPVPKAVPAPVRERPQIDVSELTAPPPVLAGPRPFLQRPVRPRPSPAEPSETAATGTPSPVEATKAAPRPAERAGIEWRQWLADVGRVRDAVAGLPPVPGIVWLAGAGLLVLVGVVRIIRSTRLLAAGRAAPPSVVRMVGETARALGIRKPPTALMVDRPISPMLWCGGRTCLVLPGPLWAQLDEVGRQAVICHELAHMKRLDHWICRAEMVIGWIYWWHPVVWWVRRRLREEADLCCDIWVTTLLPYGRRAYAEALLETRRAGSPTAIPVPAVGLGASTKRTKRFARRLTMVMTAQTSPRLSRKGALLVSVLAAAGVAATPLLACPDADKEPARSKAKAPKPSKPYTIVVPSAPPAPTAPPVASAMTTFEQFMGDDESFEERMRELERQLDRLREELRDMMRETQRSRRGGPGAGPAPGPNRSRGAGPRGLAGGLGEGDCNQIVIRSYELPEGKLEELGNLMIRDDVPIRVRVDGNRIEVHAIPRHQVIFKAFVAMIDGEEKVEAYELPQGKLEALNELMVRSDVPILVEPGSEAIQVHGTDLEQLVFGAFVDMISGHGDAHAAAQTQVYARELAELAGHYEWQATARMAEAQSLRATYREFERQAEQLERESERLEEKADRLRDKADELEDQADELRDEAEEQSGARAERLLAKAESVSAKAEALRQEAEALQEHAEAIEEQAEMLEEQAEMLEDRLDDLNDDWDDEEDEDHDEDDD